MVCFFLFHAVNHERNTPECRSRRAEPRQPRKKKNKKHPRAASHACQASPKQRVGSTEAGEFQAPRGAGPGGQGRAGTCVWMCLGWEAAICYGALAQAAPPGVRLGPPRCGAVGRAAPGAPGTHGGAARLFPAPGIAVPLRCHPGTGAGLPLGFRSSRFFTRA